MLVTAVTDPVGNVGVMDWVEVCLFFQPAPSIEVAEVEVDLVQGEAVLLLEEVEEFGELTCRRANVDGRKVHRRRPSRASQRPRGRLVLGTARLIDSFP